VGVEADVRKSLVTEGESHDMYSAAGRGEGSSPFAAFNAKNFMSDIIAHCMRNGLDCVNDYKTPNCMFFLLSIADRLHASRFSQNTDNS
jgi:hypothetical protein